MSCESAVWKVQQSSATDMWETPQALFDVLDAEFRFETDVCAIPDNAKCDRYFTPEQNGLRQEWTGVCWCNPPYGKTIGQWLAKALDAALHGATVVCLIPARTDTNYWHDTVTSAAEIRFIRGRLRFGRAKDTAPFGSAIVVFRPCGSNQMVSYIDVKQLAESPDATGRLF